MNVNPSSLGYLYIYIYYSFLVTLLRLGILNCVFFCFNQAMPYLTDRTKLPNVIDPAIKDTMDLKHLYQVSLAQILERGGLVLRYRLKELWC